MNPFPLVLSAPSGGGKTTVARLLLDRRSDVGYSVSCTTRDPRNGEIDGVDYHFLSREEFNLRRDHGLFAEFAEVHGNLYGTLKSEITRVFDHGRHLVLDIDVNGAMQLLQAYPEAVLVFLLPPSADVLRDRLFARKSDTPAVALARLRNARDELAAVHSYKYVVVNDDLERAYQQVSAIMDAETVRHSRIPLLNHRVRKLISQLDAYISGHTSTS